MARRRARGEGSIRKRKDGRWEGRYTIGRDEETGKLIYKNVLAKTQAECKRKLGEAINQQQESVENDIYRKNDATVSLPESCVSRKQTLQENHDTYTVGHWLNTWYELYSKPNLRRSTQVQYSYFIKDILLPRIGELPIQNLDWSAPPKAIPGSSGEWQDIFAWGRKSWIESKDHPKYSYGSA